MTINPPSAARHSPPAHLPVAARVPHRCNHLEVQDIREVNEPRLAEASRDALQCIKVIDEPLDAEDHVLAARLRPAAEGHRGEAAPRLGEVVEDARDRGGVAGGLVVLRLHEEERRRPAAIRPAGRERPTSAAPHLLQ